MASAQKLLNLDSLESKLTAVVVSFLVYWLAYQINHAFVDPWATYRQGISLLFLPAGVKLVVILVSGFWGMLGTVLALMCFAPDIWADAPHWAWGVYPALGGLTSWAALSVMSRSLGLDTQLSNLRFWHIPVMDGVSTLLHGLALNSFFLWVGMVQEFHLSGDALAMALGDFLGSFVLLMTLMVVLRLGWLPLKRSS